MISLLILLIAQASSVGMDRIPRPDPDGVPTTVAVGIYLLDVSDIKDVQQSFEADVFLALEWKDPRLASGAAGTERIVPLSRMWHPNYQMLGEKSVSRKLPESATVSRDGTVLYKQRMVGTFTIPLHLADFPFDSHRLALSVVSVGNSPDDVAFVALSQFMGRSSEPTLAGWSIDEGRFLVRPYRVEVLQRELAHCELEFRIRRGALFYLLRLIGPLILIVLIAWSTCWIRPLDTPAQIRLGATAFLTSVAYQFAVGGLLPKVSYLTRMDVFIAGNTLLIFLALGKAVLAESLVSREKPDAAVKLNRVFRRLYLLPVVAVIVFAFWV